MLYYPSSVTTILDIPGASYHSKTQQPNPIVYSVIPSHSLGTDAYIQIHEAAEAATDPYFTGYRTLSQGYSEWTGTESEVADLCLSTDFYYSSELNATVKSMWSNRNIAAGLPPCAEPAGAVQVFGAVPVMPTTYKDSYKSPNPANSGINVAAQVAPGESVTIPVKLFSYAALPAAMKVQAKQTNINANRTNAATFQFNPSTGNNGDTIYLTITAPQTPLPAGKYISFIIFPTMTDLKGNKHYGLSFAALIFN